MRFDDGHGRKETWLGVPRELNRFIAVLNGDSTDDFSDPALRSGTRTFYDNTGAYATSRVPVQSLTQDMNLVFIARYSDLFQLASAQIADVTPSSCSAKFEFNVLQWPEGHTIVQNWPNLPIYSGNVLQVLAGSADSYSYGSTESANVSVYQLPAAGSGNATRSVLFLARQDVANLKITIADGTRSDLCKVTIALDAGGPHSVELPDVPRDQNQFASQINASAIGTFLVVVVDGLTAAVANFQATSCPKPTCGPGRADRRLPRRAARVRCQDDSRRAGRRRQTATFRHLSVDNHETTLEGASTLFRCVPVDQPSNGGAAFVQDTAGFTGGTANLTIAAVNGGSIRVSPHKAWR